MYVYEPKCMSCFLGDQKRVLDYLELELQTVMSHRVGSGKGPEPRSVVRASNALNTEASFQFLITFKKNLLLIL